jgi:transcription initiation factor IIE alpha subunit
MVILKKYGDNGKRWEIYFYRFRKNKIIKNIKNKINKKLI